MALPHSAHRWVALAERSALRVLMIAIGLMLMVIGLGLGVSLVMLPPGIFFGLSGVALLTWGAVGELPVDN